jgi:hypothetical protein
MTPEQQIIHKPEVLNIEDYERKHLAPSQETQTKLKEAEFGKRGWTYFVPNSKEIEEGDSNDT